MRVIMKHQTRTRRQLLKEMDALHRKIAQLEALSVEYRATEAKLLQLATFPEQNPDILVELDINGQVTYLNPVAKTRFPELWHDGVNHSLLQDLPDIIQTFIKESLTYVTREVCMQEATFEQQICYSHEPHNPRVRIYIHDITRRKRAEDAIHKLANRVVHAQEKERQRLSRELHDEAGQALTALKLSLQLLEADLPLDTEVLRQNLKEAIMLSDSTMEQIRRLAWDLRPPALDTIGLNLTLESFCRDFSKRTQLLIDYNGYNVRGISDAMNICIYRVLQEALTNVVKHAQAREVTVTLSQDAHTVRLIVADNGQGFDTASGKPDSKTGGIGIMGMRERLELLGGWLEVGTGPGRGLRLSATLPVKNEDT